jgi:hypothetical protein
MQGSAIELNFASHISWLQAADTDIRNYRCKLTYTLRGIALPADALACHDLHCTNITLLYAQNEYSQSVIMMPVSQPRRHLFLTLVKL